MNWIQLAAVKQVFASCHSENVNSQLCYSEALALIEEILHVSDRQQQHEGHVSVAADLILNLMTNLYDVYVLYLIAFFKIVRHAVNIYECGKH